MKKISEFIVIYFYFIVYILKNFLIIYIKSGVNTSFIYIVIIKINKVIYYYLILINYDIVFFN